MKKKLKVSFSGGETSGEMAHDIKHDKALNEEYDIVYTFCNTSEENEETLVFVDECDKRWNLGVVWLEAVVHPGEEIGSTHKIVSFETAKRNGEVYEEVIKKYGISNMTFQPCNREMKLNPMKSYMSSIGWDDYYTAIGIRADEQRRVKRESAIKNKIVYPFIDWWPKDKQDIKDFWEDQPFKLGLEEHEGNCKWCWKKSLRKHFMLIAERPEIYDFPRRMEQIYGYHGSPCYGVPAEGVEKRVFFRQNRSTDDLFALAKEVGAVSGKAIDRRSMAARQQGFDFESGGCSESCEPYEMES